LLTAIGQCPSSPTLRQRLDVANGAFDRIVREESTTLIRMGLDPIQCHEFMYYIE